MNHRTMVFDDGPLAGASISAEDMVAPFFFSYQSPMGGRFVYKLTEATAYASADGDTHSETHYRMTFARYGSEGNEGGNRETPHGIPAMIERLIEETKAPPKDRGGKE